MTTRQLTLEDCQAVADLETQLFDGRFDAAGLRALLGKPAFYGAVLPAPDMPTTIHAYCLAYITLYAGRYYCHWYRKNQAGPRIWTDYFTASDRRDRTA